MKAKKKNVKKNKSKSIDSCSITRLVSLGNLDLVFTLRLTDEFLLENRIVFEDLTSIQDLIFVREKKEIWRDIMISSNNNSMNFLLQINKSIKKKIFIEFVILDRILFNDQQVKWKELIDYVTETNFVFLKETDIVPCHTNIVLDLKNGDRKRCFRLSEMKSINKTNSHSGKYVDQNTKGPNKNNGNDVLIEALPNQEDDFPSKDNIQQHSSCNENKQSLDIDKDFDLNLSNSPFDKIKDINLVDFNYIYIDLYDFLHSELAFFIKLKDVKKLIEYIKIHCDIQLIVNYSDIIQYDITIEDLNAIDQILLLTDIYLLERKWAYKILNEIHLQTSKSKPVYDLDKKKDINFFINEVCFQCPLNFKLKLGVFMDDLNKVTLVQVSPNAQPVINEYDATIHPKINHYNMKIVEEYKKRINASYSNYYTIFYGGMIGKLIQKEITTQRIYLSYVSGIESAKKILELDRNEMDLPKERQFYLVKLSMDKIKKNMEKQNLKQKESKFVLDCINERQSKLKFYNPLFDFHLNQFFNSGFYRKELKTKGLINTKGFIMYDSVYREMMGSSPKYRNKRRQDNCAPDELIKLIKDIKVGEKMSNKEINTKEIIRQSNSPIGKKLPNIF